MKMKRTLSKCVSNKAQEEEEDHRGGTIRLRGGADGANAKGETEGPQV